MYEALCGAVGAKRQRDLPLRAARSVTEDELGRAAPEIDDERRDVPREIRSQGRDRPSKAQKSLFVTRDQTHLKPRLLAYFLDEYGAVFRVPDGARRQHRGLWRTT